MSSSSSPIYTTQNSSSSSSILSLKQTLEGHEDRIWSISWHPLEDLFASSGADRNICIWVYDNTSSKYDLKVIYPIYFIKSLIQQSHSKTIRSLDWDKTGKLLAAGSFDGTISIWKKENFEFECISSLEGHENEVKSVSWSLSGKYLATCSRDKTIWIWDIEDNNEFSCNTVFQGHTQDVKMILWSPLEDILFSASYDNTIKVWDYDHSQEDWACINTLSAHQSTVWSIAFTNDGKHLLSCGDDRQVILWKIGENYKNIEKVRIIQNAHKRTVYSISCSHYWPNMGYFACSGGGDNALVLYRFINANEHDINNDLDFKIESTYVRIIILIKKEDAHDEDINCVAFHPNKPIMATCSDDLKIHIWTLSNHN